MDNKSLVEMFIGKVIVNIHDRKYIDGIVSVHFEDGAVFYIEKMHVWDKGGDVVFEIGSSQYSQNDAVEEK